MKKHNIKLKLDLQPANINDLLETEEKEISKLTNFLKNHNFINEEDYILKSDLNTKGLFVRFLRNTEDSTIARIVCNRKVGSSGLNKSVALVNVNCENEILFSECSNQGDFLPDCKIKKGFTTKDFNRLENLIKNHKEIIKKENINMDYVKLSASESEEFINEIDKKDKVKEGYWQQNGETYLYTNKALNIITIKSLKEILKNKIQLFIFLIIFLYTFFKLAIL